MYIYFFIIIFSIIIVLSKIEEDCSSYLDCFNCTISSKCNWYNKTCLNISEIEPNNFTLNKISPEDNTTERIKGLLNLKNDCYKGKGPFIPEEKNIPDKEIEKYCGERLIVITNNILING